MTTIPLTVADDADELARLAGAAVATRIRDAHREPFTLALSGGHTPRAMLHQLARRADTDWTRVEIFQVDERVAPAGNPDRNLTMLDEALLQRVTVGAFHPMPVDDTDLAAAADDYASALPVALDLLVLGLGADGHTASLVPGDPVLDVTDRDVALTAQYQGRRRMTLTYAALNRADHIVWLVSGRSKGAALQQLLAGDRSIPAGRVRPDRAHVLADREAASASTR